jgi:hypothetical protein
MADGKVQLATIKLQEKQLDLQAQQQAAQIENAKVLQTAVEQGMPLLKDYLHAKMKNVDSPKFKWSIVLFGAVLLVCVIGSGFLVFFDKMESGSFTFLLGTLIGGIITFMGDLLLPQQQ